MEPDSIKTTLLTRNVNTRKRLPNVTNNAGNVIVRQSGGVTNPEFNSRHNFAKLKIATVNFLQHASLMPPRDLFLGGRGTVNNSTRKIFLPNLHVTRNKNASVKTSKDKTTLNRGRNRSRGSERGNARNYRHASSLIQTTGVFSEGVGELKIKKPTSSLSYQRNNDDSSVTILKPIIKKEEEETDLKNAIEKDKDILKSLDEDDTDNMDDVDEFDCSMLPIKLREINLASSNQEESQQNTFNQRPESRYPQSVEKMLSNIQTQIFLMQFPDILPCMQDNSTSINKCVTTKLPVTSAILKTLEEGEVGRVLRYKSGKCKLVLGETHFDLNTGAELGFLQDVMCIKTNREERNGDMINLGSIQANLTATPDWEHLLMKKTQKLNKL